MDFQDKIMVCALKGTPPAEPGTPAAFAECTACGKELVYDARNKAFMEREKLKPYCGACAAELVLSSGRDSMAYVQGRFAGEPSDVSVKEFIDRLKASAKETIQ